MLDCTSTRVNVFVGNIVYVKLECKSPKRQSPSSQLREYLKLLAEATIELQDDMG